MDLDTLTIIVICLGISFIMSEIFFRIRYPRVIGQILAGVILSIPPIKILFTPDIMSDIEFLSDMGIIFLLLLAGLQLNLRTFKKSEKDALIVAVFSAVIPLFLGFGLMRAIGYSNVVAVVVGSCFAITAEATTLKLLLDMRVLNTKLGTIILGAGILDDIFEIMLLGLVLVFAHKTLQEFALLPFKLILFVAIAYLTYKLFPSVVRVIQKEHSRVSIFTSILIFALIIALISKRLGFGPIIGAFIAGIIIQLSEKKKYEHLENVKELQVMTFSFVIPFFFISIGLHFDYTSLSNNLWTTLFIVFVAIVGKIIGAVVVTPFTDLNLKQAHLVGWGMNSRGEMELVIAEIGRKAGLIPIEIYSAIVLMAVITTLLFPFVLRGFIRHDKKIMDE